MITAANAKAFQISRFFLDRNCWGHASFCVVCNACELCTQAFASKSDFALLFTYLFINGTQIAEHRFEEVAKKFVRATALSVT